MNQRAVGRIRTAHGLTGELKVTSYSGNFDHFSQLGEVELRRDGLVRPARITAFRRLGEGGAIKLEGVVSPEAAKALANFEIWANADMVQPLGPGEYYLADMIGCAVRYQAQTLGEVTGFVEGLLQETLEVRCLDGTLRLLPLLDVYVSTIDLETKTISLQVPWILE